MTAGALLSSAAILGGVGTLFALVIALAQRRLYVWEDPRIDAVTGMLPGANCGACGQVGCRAFAEKLVGGQTEPATCTVLSSDDRSDLASYLGVEVGSATRRVARLLCAGGSDVAPTPRRVRRPADLPRRRGRGRRRQGLQLGLPQPGRLRPLVRRSTRCS